MEPLQETRQAPRRSSPFTAQDVRIIAERRGWLPVAEGNAEQDPDGGARQGWMTEAAQLLGPQAANAGELEALLERIFQYDARRHLAFPENQAVMAREGARHVLRELASLVLDSAEVNSDRYKEIVATLKEQTGRRGQELFHPVRLALAGRAGEGEFDRVILLLDGAARLEWTSKVKNCRERMLEFCGAFD
jgi:glutamyl-tRNA synthetase/nondiscriminating glutamyl-tRNA synthetase